MSAIEFEEHQPPVSPEALDAAERALAELGQRIPASYRAFLAAHDGGPPIQDTFSFQEGQRQQQDLVSFFLGVAPSPDGDLVETAQALDGRVLPGMLPIAGDPVGNFLLLDTRDGVDGPVWFWDHELETDPPDDSNLSEVAPDLATFLDRLTENPNPPQPQSPGPTGLKRLFRRNT